MMYVGYTTIHPWIAWLPGGRSCIHKFAGVGDTVFVTYSLVIVCFTGAAFGLDLFCYSAAVDGRGRQEVVGCLGCSSCPTVHHALSRRVGVAFWRGVSIVLQGDLEVI